MARRLSPLPPAPTTLSPLLDGRQAAALLGCTRNALEQWRQRSVGPAYVRVGALIRYRETDLVDWIERQTQQTRDTRPAA